PYFDRLLARATQLQQNGIYAIVQLFDGLGINGNRCGTTSPNGDGYPFTGTNNVNGVDDGYTSGSSGIGSMSGTVSSAILNVQDGYVKKVIDTLNALPNVIWEISEEAPDDSTSWHDHMIALIRTYEATKAVQHPIGYPTLNVAGASDSTLFNSNADWVAPQTRLSPANNCGSGTPPCKIDINDSDHTYFGMWNDSEQMNRNYLWENFTNGAHVLFMDPYLIYWTTGSRNLCDNATTPPNGVCTQPDARWNNFRDNMGYMLVYGNTKLDLANMSAQPGLTSTGYCLADDAATGGEFLVYAANGGNFTVNLSAQSGATLRVEWLDPSTGVVTNGGTVPGGSSSQSFTPPWGASSDAVLYLVDAAGHN
ncbi:MAG: putative collagen-binding domain-containing protein, partial [Steroidobacteraceae bacterium]